VNQPHSVWADYGESSPMVDLTGACITCMAAGTICSTTHPTASQAYAIRATGVTP
jgi:hypothetical protein